MPAGEELKLTKSEAVRIVRAEPDVLEVEATYGPAGKPPPKHLHPSQDEHFKVLEGKLTTRVDGVEREIAAGDELEIPRGAVHQMWNPGTKEARVSWETRPAGRTEEWFRAVDGLISARAEGEPGPLDFGPLLSEYDDTFVLAVAPAPLRKPLTSALGALGRLRGRG